MERVSVNTRSFALLLLATASVKLAITLSIAVMLAYFYTIPPFDWFTAPLA